MDISELTRQNVIDALKYIDENGVPSRRGGHKYELVTEEGNRYPIKCVVEKAIYIASGTNENIGSTERLREQLKKLGFHIEIIKPNKAKQEKGQEERKMTVKQYKGYRNQYSSMLIESKNIIFHGAPGTGKSFLAKAIAADISSNGETDN